MSDILDEWVEKAAEALRAMWGDWAPRAETMRFAEAALAAVADDIRREAWHEGYVYAGGGAYDYPGTTDPNPYRARAEGVGK